MILNRALLRHAAVAGLATALTIAGSTPARAGGAGGSASAPPSGVGIISIVQMSGSGCPANSVGLHAAPDNSSFLLSYRGFQPARLGGGASPTAVRKNCQVNVQIQSPPGYSHSIKQVTYRGSAELTSGATATVRGHFYRSGAPTPAARTWTFPGPVQGPWEATAVVEDAAVFWAPCGSPVLQNLSTELRLAWKTADHSTTNAISMDSPDDDVYSEYQLVWRECSQP